MASNQQDRPKKNLRSAVSKEWFILTRLISQHFVLRYRRSVLGYFWSLLNPIVYMSVTATVFSLILKFPIEHYAVYLFAGMVPWWFLNNAVTQGGRCLIDSEHLLKKLNVSKFTLIFASCLSLFIDSLLSFAALVFLVFIFKGSLPVTMFILPISFLIIFMLGLTLTVISAISFCYLRDLEHITSLAMQTFFYLTPIMYPLVIIPAEKHHLFELNPFFHFIKLFHAPIYEGVIPDYSLWLKPLGTILIMALIALVIYKTFSKRLIFKL